MAITYNELVDLLEEDAIYAEELQLKEALMASSSSSTREQLLHDLLEEDENVPRKRIRSWDDKGIQLTQTKKERKSYQQRGESSQQRAESSFCMICMEQKPTSEMFRNGTCSHLFCSDCIAKHVAVKIQENVSIVKCPDPKCEEAIEPDLCRSILAKDVFGKWEDALCEATIIGSQKFYCPFKDCSAMLVDDGSDVVTASECPNCRRLFCAQCKVSYHAGVDCTEFQKLKKKKKKTSSDQREEEMVMKLAKRKRWKRCPKCKFFVQKRDGCVHISCRCGCQFCYRCGLLWTDTHLCP